MKRPVRVFCFKIRACRIGGGFDDILARCPEIEVEISIKVLKATQFVLYVFLFFVALAQLI